MMFNGLLVCGDSDTSDFTKESIGASSGAESASSDQLSAPECLQSKLLATMQILENKEETVRVQAQSLALAESRIAALTAKAERYRQRLAQVKLSNELTKAPLQSPLGHGTRSVEKTDTSINTDLYQEDTSQKGIVLTLQDNLSVIEDLYKECFYETAKQEELIDLLRKSCSDVRVMEKRKSEQIGRLQYVVDNQKWSLDRCQDIAMEVDNLKSEISNFLNSSNHDSGVWERERDETLAGEVAAELQQVGGQLLHLRDLLASDCVCGLRNENVTLRQKNQLLEKQNEEMHERTMQLEADLQEKNEQRMRVQEQLNLKEDELQQVTLQLTALQQNYDEQAASCDSQALQLQHLQSSLSNKSEALFQLQQDYDARGAALEDLRKQLEKAQLVIEQERSVREEVRRLSRAVCAWRAQLSGCQQRMRGLHHELQQARDYCQQVTQQFREKESDASQLKEELEEAHSRGAQLCGDTRRLVGGLRTWLQRHRERISEQEEKIKEQDAIIRRLQQPPDGRTSGSEEPCCSRYITPRQSTHDHCNTSRDIPDCIKCVSLRKRSSSNTVKEVERSCARRTTGERDRNGERSSESERTSCTSPPRPPRRFSRKKKPSSTDCNWTHCDVAVQRPVRSDAATGTGGACQKYPHCDCNPPTLHRAPSSTDELLERVEGARYALHEAHARWNRPHAHTHRHAHQH